MSFPNVLNISLDETLNTYTAENIPVGSKAVAEDGTIYRFAENGGTVLTTGKLLEAVAPSTNYTDETVATLAAGVTTLTGIGSTAADGAINLFKYGYCWSSTATNLNPIMRIKSNTLITSGASTGTFVLYNPTVAAFAAADTISYVENLWRDIVITTNATPLASLVGVSVTPIAADGYGWVQTGGICRALIVGSVVLGCEVIPAATAGSVGPNDSETTQLTKIVGYAATVEATTEYGPIFLTLD